MYGVSAIRAAASSMRATRRAAASRSSCAMYAKSRRDRRERRVHTAASCSAVAAEQSLDFFIACEISPGGTLFDKLPFFVGDVVRAAPLFEDRKSTRLNSSHV